MTAKRMWILVALMSLAGIHDDPSRASISPGSRSAGWTAFSASILRSKEESSPAAAAAVASLRRTSPLK